MEDKEYGRGRGYIVVSTRGETARIMLADITYIERDLRQIVIHTKRRVFRFYAAADDIAGYLDGRFHRCHRSLTVNLDNIESVGGGTIVFADGTAVSLNRDAFRLLRREFEAYLRGERKGDGETDAKK